MLLVSAGEPKILVEKLNVLAEISQNRKQPFAVRPTYSGPDYVVLPPNLGESC
jgi:hypothetical protein